jgi:hypothetical protein
MRLRTALLLGLAGAILAPGTAPAAEAGRERRAYAEPGAETTARGAAALPEQQIAKRIAEQLGVQVLKVTPTDGGDPPTYAVRVMNPPGNDNAAFLVSTLLVDAITGAVLGQARPAPSAAWPDATPLTRTPQDVDSGPELRRRTFR